MDRRDFISKVSKSSLAIATGLGILPKSILAEIVRQRQRADQEYLLAEAGKRGDKAGVELREIWSDACDLSTLDPKVLGNHLISSDSQTIIGRITD
jgi:hypothetical protein